MKTLFLLVSLLVPQLKADYVQVVGALGSIDPKTDKDKAYRESLLKAAFIATPSDKQKGAMLSYVSQEAVAQGKAMTLGEKATARDAALADIQGKIPKDTPAIANAFVKLMSSADQPGAELLKSADLQNADAKIKAMAQAAGV